MTDPRLLPAFPLETVLLPGELLPLQVFEPRYLRLVEYCVTRESDFAVVGISRGSEVGGGEQRFDVGCVARILRVEGPPGGRLLLLSLGVGRFRAEAWPPDDPHPWVMARDWPDPDPVEDGGVDELIEAVSVRLAELGDRPAGTDPAAVDPTVFVYEAAARSPIGPLDRQRLLECPDVGSRLELLVTLLDGLLEMRGLL